MTDVAGAVLLPELGVEVELVREHVAHLPDGRRDTRSEIERVEVAPSGLERPEYARHDVAHVHEVAALAAVLEDDGRSSVQQPAREDRRDTRVGIREGLAG